MDKIRPVADVNCKGETGGRGPFLESPGNFSGPKSNIQIEIWSIRERVLAILFH